MQTATKQLCVNHRAIDSGDNRGGISFEAHREAVSTAILESVLTCPNCGVKQRGHDLAIMASGPFGRASLGYYRSSPSRPSDAGSAGVTATRNPVRTHALWLGANRGASKPSLISRVTAKRLNEV